MVPKVGALLVLMTATLGGCAVWTRVPPHQVSYDYSDHAFYDHPYAPSPVYTANFVQNVRIAASATEEQTAPTLAKTAPPQKAEGGADIPEVEVSAPPPAGPAARSSSPSTV